MSAEVLLERLARLGPQDRAWLLGELPAGMRRELASMLADEPASSTAAITAPPAAVSAWETLDPQRLAAVLDGEPAWLVSAATRGTEARWRDRLLHAMESRRRHEIELADRTGASFGARAVSCVLEGCRARLASSDDATRAAAPKSRFAALVDQMKERFS